MSSEIYETIAVPTDDKEGGSGGICDEEYLFRNISDLADNFDEIQKLVGLKIEGPFFKDSPEYKSVVRAMGTVSSTVDLIVCRNNISEFISEKIRQKLEKQKNMFVFLGSVNHKKVCDIPTTVLICELHEGGPSQLGYPSEGRFIEIHLLCNQREVAKGGKKVLEHGLGEMSKAYPSVPVYLSTGKNKLVRFYEELGFEKKKFLKNTKEYIMVRDQTSKSRSEKVRVGVQSFFNRSG